MALSSINWQAGLDGEKMRVLLTNDDGILADGLWSLYREFAKEHQVTIVAPDTEKSAVGHGITLYSPLRVKKIMVDGKTEALAVDGTPADCVKLALLELLDSKPDLVVSGINPGANVGVNLNYSGTVAAAREACLYGIAAMAVSVDSFTPRWYPQAARITRLLGEKAYGRGLDPGVFLNVNFPDLPLEQMDGIIISRQAMQTYPEYFDKRRDPRQRVYYWQVCEAKPKYEHKDEDGAVLGAGRISVTPVKCDTTDHASLKELKGWNLDLG